jgi:hypothetical protein
VGAGLFALLWIVHRAAVQSITLDEADTFNGMVLPDWPSYWYPSSGNHVLNSMLIRLCVRLFGLSELAMRAPALLGGGVYIYAAFRICTLLSDRMWLKLPLFISFVYNPFVMDYLVAARGYGLAIGFFTLALYVIVRMLAQERYTVAGACTASICVGLSFCSNFSFAYANAFLMGVFLAWTLWRQPSLRLAAACVLPALIIVFVITGSVLLDFPKSQLYYGAHSLTQMWNRIRDSSFGPLNDYLVNRLLAVALQGISPFLVRIGVVVTLCMAALLALRRQFWPGLRVSAYASTVFGLTLLAHWVQFKLGKIPLPLDRTSLFIVPLALVIAGAVLSVDALKPWERAIRTMGIATLVISAVYFTGSIRDSYFLEWKFGADVNSVFPVAADLARKAGQREIQSTWQYSRSLEFYQHLYGVKDLQIVNYLDQPPPGKDIYVLQPNDHEEFIKKESLQIVYRGPISNVVIAIRPCKNTKND